MEGLTLLLAHCLFPYKRREVLLSSLRESGHPLLSNKLTHLQRNLKRKDLPKFILSLLFAMAWINPIVPQALLMVCFMKYTDDVTSCP